MHERFEIYIVYKRRYINTLPFLFLCVCVFGVCQIRCLILMPVLSRAVCPHSLLPTVRTQMWWTLSALSAVRRWQWARHVAYVSALIARDKSLPHWCTDSYRNFSVHGIVCIQL